MDDLESLKFDIEAGIVGVDNDGSIVLFDPDSNQVGYCGADWDELTEEDRVIAARKWAKSKHRFADKCIAKRKAHYHISGYVEGSGI